MKTVAYLSGEFPRASDTFIQREVAALRARGHAVVPCSIRRTGAAHLVGPEQRALQAETFHVLEALRRPATALRAHARWLRHPRRYAAALALAWRTSPPGLRALAYQLIYFAEAGVLADHLARVGADHLHNHIAKASCTVAMLAAALSGLPYSFTIHGPDIFFDAPRWRLDEKARRAAFVACISHFARAQLMCFAAPETWERLHVIHCGVDPARYARAPGRDPCEVLFVGRLAAVKGVPLLIDAMGTLPDAVHLTLIGDGSDRAALEAQVRRAGLDHRVRFLGYQSQDAVAEALGRAGLFVLPSFAEGVPVVLMEAMAAELPVIATRIAGIPELIRDGETGLLVAAGDGAALGAAMAALIADPDRAAGLGRAARDTVIRAFDAAGEAAKLSRLIEETVA